MSTSLPQLLIAQYLEYSSIEHTNDNMHFLSVSIAAMAAIATTVLAEDVGIEITREVECPRKSMKGDMISVHYRGTLKDGGNEFDSSYKRGQPLDFMVGQGQVIKGWDDNLIGMCVGDKRTLSIPPEHGYGDRDMGPIPAGSTLSTFLSHQCKYTELTEDSL